VEEDYEIAAISKLRGLVHLILCAGSIVCLSIFVNPYPNIIIFYYVFRFFYTQKIRKIPPVSAICQGSVTPEVVPKGFYYLPNSCCGGVDYMEECIPKETLGL
jgi:4-hydroxybenzoate polyprenyltransferase